MRFVPGTHAQSLCVAIVEWLKEVDFDGPISLNAIVEKTTGSENESLFERTSKVFDRILNGESLEQQEAGEEASSLEGEATEDEVVTAASS